MNRLIDPFQSSFHHRSARPTRSSVDGHPKPNNFSFYAKLSFGYMASKNEKGVEA